MAEIGRDHKAALCDPPHKTGERAKEKKRCLLRAASNCGTDEWNEGEREREEIISVMLILRKEEDERRE